MVNILRKVRRKKEVDVTFRGPKHTEEQLTAVLFSQHTGGIAGDAQQDERYFLEV
jgi:hypothetical protein